MLALKIPCILLQIATVWVGGLMILEHSHGRTDKVVGAVIVTAATISAILIAR